MLRLFTTQVKNDSGPAFASAVLDQLCLGSPIHQLPDSLTNMRFVSIPIALSACIVALTGCADAPPPRATSPAVTAIKPTAASSPAPSASPAVTSDPTAAIEAALALGYLPRKKFGVAVYCRNEAGIGSRFGKEICISQERIPDVVQRALNDQRMVETLQRECVGPACGKQ